MASTIHETWQEVAFYGRCYYHEDMAKHNILVILKFYDMKESNAFINLNYDSRKAVINLSLKQLKNITGTDADLTEYPQIFSESMFKEYPRRLNALVMLPSHYEESIKELEAVNLEKISEMESKIKQLESEIKTLRNERDTVKEAMQLQKEEVIKIREQLQSLLNSNNEYKSELEEESKKVDLLKDYKFYDYQIRKDKVSRTLQSLEHISLWDFIKKEHKAIIKRYYDDIQHEEIMSRDRIFNLENTSADDKKESETNNP